MIVISQNISDAMVVVNSDDEEELKHLLSQDSSPLRRVQNGDNIDKNQLLPRCLIIDNVVTILDLSISNLSSQFIHPSLLGLGYFYKLFY